MIALRHAFVLTASAALTFAPLTAYAATYYVATNGNDTSAGTMAAPFRTPGRAAGVAQAGDTVYFRTGTHPGGIHPVRSGTASAWITFSAAPGEFPILDGSAGDSAGFEPQSAVVAYIRVIGIAVRNFGSSGFSNGWNFPSSHIEIRDCLAENNGINGITFYGRTSASAAIATGVLIQNSIIAHNGNRQPSWSSGVNIYQVGGTFQDNQVIGNVSFENIDISANHSDGSGFILDFGSTGALFQNNIGFRNGGSCIRVTNSAGAHLINNTCYHDALDPNNTAPALAGEIFFSDPTASTNVVVQNNLLAAVTGMNAFNRTTGTGAMFLGNLAVNANGPTPFFLDPGRVDLRLAADATTVIDRGSAAGAPATDSGFDPRCITPLAGQAVSWWQYAPDYVYIQSVGGVAGCFHPTARPQGPAPDIGAYEFGGTPVPGTGGAAGGGGRVGATGTGGAGGGAGTAGRSGAGGAGTGGGGPSTAGTTGMAGRGGVNATGGRAATGGASGPGDAGGQPGMTGGAGGAAVATGGSGSGGLQTDAGAAGAAGASGGCACTASGELSGTNAGRLVIAMMMGAIASLRKRRRAAPRPSVDHRITGIGRR